MKSRGTRLLASYMEFFQFYKGMREMTRIHKERSYEKQKGSQQVIKKKFKQKMEFKSKGEGTGKALCDLM